MDELTLKLIQLDHCRGISRKTITAFLKADPDLNQIADYTLNDLTDFFHLKRVHAERFIQDYHAFYPDQAVRYYEQRDIYPVPIHSSWYPTYLKKIYDPPYVLYTKGKRIRLKDRKMLSVVGTRHPSPEAKKIIERLVLPLIESGWTIISGLASGIDGMAHELALSGRTIAVLGSGLFFPYPHQNIDLFHTLTAEQLVISEYPPPSRPERWRFPERNRVISGLSLGTLVIEARERSGSLITADQALEQGREVMAVPGSILKENSRGTNRLIQMGAKMVIDSSDIIEELRIYE
ncbi:DNA-protecting protein DprA [Sporolactobacillus sp. THM7-4]|nr:DNA-protecting protein DprA [Sporolactobacillus sp. THM7-4]